MLSFASVHTKAFAHELERVALISVFQLHTCATVMPLF
jgi:hypothetical protein